MQKKSPLQRLPLLILVSLFMLTVSGCAGPAPTPFPQVPAPTDTPAGPMPVGIPGAWSLVFADEFDGEVLSPADWCPDWVNGQTCDEITDPVNTSEAAAYDPAQVSVSGGSLNLTLIESPVTVGDNEYAYRSGMVQTNGKLGQTPLHEFVYGVFEARINLPGAEGRIYNWPAWWTDGQRWPTDGEMDIMEGLSGLAQYHFHSDLTGAGGNPGGDYTGWHTYAADWQSGVVTYYYDGQPIGAQDFGITDSPMYLILNYATGGCCAGKLVTPAVMQVDYVRVWQHPAE